MHDMLCPASRSIIHNTYHGESYIRAALWTTQNNCAKVHFAPRSTCQSPNYRSAFTRHLVPTPNVSLGRNPKARQERADLHLIRLSDERLDLRLRAEQPGDFAGDVRADVPRISHQIGRWRGGRREPRVRGLVSDGLFLEVYVRHASASVLCGGKRFCFSEQPHQLVQ
jgi:hypothetical protein